MRDNQNQEHEGFYGELRLGSLLNNMPLVMAVGLALVPGLFLLLAQALIPGAVAPLAASLVGFLALGLTLLSVLEFLPGSTERSGTYSLIFDSLGEFSGWVAGWAGAAACVVLGAAVLRAAARQLAVLLPQGPLREWHVALMILLLLGLLQLFRLTPRQEWILPAALLLLVVGFGFLQLAVLRQGRAVGGEQGGGVGFLHVAAWMAVAYQALEAVLASRRQIQPGKGLLPRALVGVSVAAAVFLLLGVAAVQWGAAGGSVGFLGAAVQAGVPLWLAAGLGAWGAILAANTCLMTGARLLHSLSRRGVLPPRMRAVRRPFRLPPWLVLSLVLPSGLLSWLGNPLTLLNLAAALTLTPMLLLNAAAVLSRSTEPERRRPFALPFHPLIPASTLALLLALLLALPGSALAALAGWLLVGSILFLLYGRRHILEAQEGEQIFAGSRRREKAEGTYRILVPVGTGMERHVALELASVLARQIKGELIPLQVITMADPLAMEEGRRLAQERNTLFQWSIRYASRFGVPIFPITRLARHVPEGILETAQEEQCDLIVLPWLVTRAERGFRLGRVLDPVVRKAPCDVVVLAMHEDFLDKVEARAQEALEAGQERARKLPLRRILVTTAGGPHAPLATRLAVLLGREYQATVQVAFVADPDAGPEALREGEVRIQKTHEAMREQAMAVPGGEGFGEIPFTSQVITAPSVLEGIVQAGAESDLVLIGASEESLIDQVLFGSLPEAVARTCPTPVLMVKRYRGLRRQWLERAWDALYRALPSLEPAERVTVYRQVRRSARPDVDFFVMIGLSAIIATYGLLQDSGAVIIGAMLVAPLFTPILALSLAIVQGDIYLLRLAVEAALKGIALAVGVALAITALSPLRIAGHEVLARTQPNLFDLAVALASGAAGAYAIARKEVAAALPGVAIAAALVPPLGVVGVGLALGNVRIAGGASLLFLTNLVAIVLAGAVILLLLGFRPSERGVRETRLRVGLITSVVLLVLVSVPLALFFVRSVQATTTRRAIEYVLREAEAEGLELVEFDYHEGDERISITARFYVRQEISPHRVGQWRTSLQEALERPVRLEVEAIPLSVLEAGPP